MFGFLVFEKTKNDVTENAVSSRKTNFIIQKKSRMM